MPYVVVDEMNKRVGIIGLGRMGQALALGLLSSGALKPQDILARVRTEEALSACSSVGIEGTLDLRSIVENCELIFLCVRSDQAVSATKELALCAGENRNLYLISMCAGVPLAALNPPEMTVTKPAKAIANINIQTSDGVTVLFAEDKTNEAFLTAKSLLEHLGHVVEASSEEECDQTSTFSATIPAFVSVTISALIDSGIASGVPRELSQTIAAQVTEGTARCMQKLQLSPEKYQKRVTSPGGVVIKGVEILESNRLRSTYIEALAQVARLVRNTN